MPLLTNLNGAIAHEAQVSVLDRGFLYGDSIYEVVRTFHGRPFGLEAHLVRLRNSAAALYMTVPWSNAHILEAVADTLAQADWQESYIRIVVTRGVEAKISLQPGAHLVPNLLIVISPIDDQPRMNKAGHHLVIPARQRNAKEALNPAAKTGNYLNNILALLEAQQMGADDALLLNAKGEVTEATTSNLWVVREDVVQTPPTEVGILPGITRDFILDILRQRQIPHQEVVLQPSDLGTATEGFLSSSVRLLMPIRQINNCQLPHCPGPLTQLLWDALLERMAAGS